MRLSKIKLAGFKSFVDPTTVQFPHNLTGVVGPNGCGKSNIIDAVRWVMGESSAKTLRGESMADVIFNGSTSRKPVGQASIELVFDNSDGGAGGQYAEYNEISVRRQVTRDGQSAYFLNGVRCRRRDIQDLFLGTGMGPRSYAIIEQGMISRFVEAKPDDLRQFIEEAAGVSKYKERRRETENRMRHTRENLERLNDLREEVSRQLEKLQRQARTAERYQTLKEEERQVRAERLALRWRTLDKACMQRSLNMQQLETDQEGSKADQSRLETEIEKKRLDQQQAHDRFNDIQGQYYGLGGEIGRVEQAIEHARDRTRQTQDELRRLQQEQQTHQARQDMDSSRLAELDLRIEEYEPEHEELVEREAELSERLSDAETAMREWQHQWDDFNREAQAPAQQAQIERNHINQLEQQSQRTSTRLTRLDDERGRMDATNLEDEIRELAETAAEREMQRDEQEEQLRLVQNEIAVLRDAQQQQSQQLDSLRREAQAIAGRRASLESLQEASLKDADKSLSQWLQANGLDQQPRLAQQLSVQAGWELAVETVLASYLDAVSCGSVAEYAQSWPAGVTLVESSSEAAQTGRLTEMVNSAPALVGVLNTVYRADSDEQALSLRPQLQAHESVITPAGVWMGPDWVRVPPKDDNPQAGVLARERELREIIEQQSELEARIEAADSAVSDARERLQQQERQREESQQNFNRESRELNEISSKLSARRTRLEQMQSRLNQLDEERQDLLAEREQAEEDMLAARERLHEALELTEHLEERRDALRDQGDKHRQIIDEARLQSRDAREALHQVALTLERDRSEQRSLQQTVNRAHEISADLAERLEELMMREEESTSPLDDLQQELEEKLGARLEVEAQLGDARSELEAREAEIRDFETRRVEADRSWQELREKLEKLRLEQQETLIRRETAAEQLSETGLERESLLAELPEEADETQWERQEQALGDKIKRLGAINLAAIDEFEAQSERMRYLDAQFEDLNESLETLESAINKIDKETRTRFKETFDRVNSDFQALFPRLFGGGHAFLDLTGTDLLDTGITLMARPPGKKNSTIHLLSGGEKALTAVALVFAIFQLNPAPFCMLDEVDAPLDDANVNRFCDMVREMSEHVQFIFITHNKVTMELADQLAGVTMQEPGVSRTVSVDVEAAAELAGVQ